MDDVFATIGSLKIYLFCVVQTSNYVILRFLLMIHVYKLDSDFENVENTEVVLSKFSKYYF